MDFGELAILQADSLMMNPQNSAPLHQHPAHPSANGSESSEQPVKRKRGRPPKPKGNGQGVQLQAQMQTQMQSQVQTHIPHAGAFGNVMSFQQQLSAPLSQLPLVMEAPKNGNEPPKKRGRGRPRKERTPAEEAAYEAMLAARAQRKLNPPPPDGKRGRGRPKKIKDDNTTAKSVMPLQPNGSPGSSMPLPQSYNPTLPGLHSFTALTSANPQFSTDGQADLFMNLTHVDSPMAPVKRGRGRPPKDRSAQAIKNVAAV
ncbi:hypothetical protein HDU67_003946 [Dinochytrium kinnereticum]|nr:hypothetical protein HDU67_003946 [Dinochytrium kinnereticum]